MKAIVCIILSSVSMISLAQEKPATDCRDVNFLMERVWKHYQGNEKWLKTMDSVLTICPNSARIWGDRAMAYMIRGEYVEGLAYLDKAVSLDPFYYLGNRAWYRMRYLHDYKGAIADLEKLEQVAGHTLVYVTNAHMYIMKGLAYKELGEVEKALEQLDFAIKEQINSKGPEWLGVYDYLYRGILKYRTDDFEGAIEDLTLQVKQYESLADTYYYRGMAYAATGRKDEARLDLQRAKDILLNGGEKRWESFVVVADEIFLSDVDNALLRLY
ncbi:MAG TPA: tetratricopeptide repeat protein [Cyclobacteriaceae bacterium]|nr:tetratricopeptide repeat protein [Cyclobacteriaceae bacterium]